MTTNSKQESFQLIDSKNYKPLIKWAGGKSRLNKQLLKVTDVALSELNLDKVDYFEPFFGGGALFFELHQNEKINNAYINDIIPHLISFYKTVSKKNYLNELFTEIEMLVRTFETGDQASIYGSVKQNTGWVKEFNDLWSEKHPKNKEEKLKSAALFYVLNKSGFNGMFRLNKEGKFNIPKGDSKKINFNENIKNNFISVSSILSNASIHCGSYENILPPEKDIDYKRSFIYLDPPYIPDSKTADFTDYSKEGFKEADHRKVANIFYQLAEGGYKVVLSNNANKSAKEMYAGNNEVYAYEVDVSRSIARTKKGKRPPSKELLVSSFNLDVLGMVRV